MTRDPQKMFAKYTRADVLTAEDANPTNLRNTLFIGLGGFGCSTIRTLKQEINDLVPGRADGYCFLGLDTQKKEIDDVLDASEYVELSLGVIPDEVARRQPQQLDWYRKLVGSYQARGIQSGADQMKALGRLSFRVGATFADFMSKLDNARRGLMSFREGFTPGVIPKIYIISSVAGGTGAGCVLDVMLVVGHYFRQHLGPDFPYQAVFVAPDTFSQKVRKGLMPKLHANSYATLKEINHFITSGHSQVEDYDDAALSGLRVDAGLLPRVMHLLGTTNEEGAIVAATPEEVSALAVSYVMSELITPLDIAAGGARIQDMENEEFTNRGANDLSLRVFSSFGVVRAGFPISEVETSFAFRLIRETLAREVIEPASAFNDAENWVDENKLREAGNEVNHLQDAIRHKMPDHLRVAIDVFGALMDDLNVKKLVADARKYSRNQRKLFEEARKPKIGMVSEQLGQGLLDSMNAVVGDRQANNSLGSAYAFLGHVLANIKQQSSGLKKEIVSARESLEQRENDLDFSLSAMQAAIPGFLFRKKRLNLAVGDFESRLEGLINNEIDIWVKEAGVVIYARLIKAITKLRTGLAANIKSLSSRMQSVERHIHKVNGSIDSLASIEERGAGGHFSIVDATNVSELFAEVFNDAEIEGSILRLRSEWLKPREGEKRFAKGLLLDTDASTVSWINQVGPKTVIAEVRSKLAGFDLISIINRFLPTDSDKRLFFGQIQSLSSPLFPLDANDRESDYPEYWIVAVNPEKKKQFDRTFRDNFAANINYAHINSKYEFILYQIKYGYTPHSHRTIEISESHYDRLQKAYEKARKARRPEKPIHGWIGAEHWDDLVPDPETESTLKWFVLGRAFNYLFPTKGELPNSRKNTSFIYARGSNYYIKVEGRDGEEQIQLGNGLETALYSLSDRSDLQDILDKSIERKTHESNLSVLKSRLTGEYRPLLLEEKEKAEKSRSETRIEILRKLLKTLDDFVQEHLSVSVV